MSPNPPAITDASPPATCEASTAAPVVVRALDGIVFSSGLAAAIGAAFSMVASQSLGAPRPFVWAFLTASGAFIIYGLDRLRDVDRDRVTSPLRTAFVLRHRRRLSIALCIASIGFAATLLRTSPAIFLLCGAIGLIGFFHRRMKQAVILKAAYVSVAWVAACVGMPWIASGPGRAGAWISAILLASLGANLLASNLRDDQTGSVSGTHTPILWIARAMLVIAIVIAFLAPAALAPLAWIPACEGVALATFRSSERYGHIAVDGALLVGALASAAQLAWLA